MTEKKQMPILEEQSNNLEDSAGFFSFIFMTFLDSLFAKGSKKPLEQIDLGTIGNADRSDLLYEKFAQEYDVESKYPLLKRSLWGILWRTTGYVKLVRAIVLYLISAALAFGPVMILTRLVRYFQGVDVYETWELWLQVSLLFIFPVVSSISLAHSNAIMAHVGAQVKIVILSSLLRVILLMMYVRDLSFTFMGWLNRMCAVPLTVPKHPYLRHLQKISKHITVLQAIGI